MAYAEAIPAAMKHVQEAIDALPLPPMPFKYSDGGRAAAGYKGTAGDCATRAIALATGKPYQEVYDALFALAREHRDDQP